MLTNIMKWIAILALLVGIIWPSSVDYRVVLQFVVCAAAILALVEAQGVRKYLVMVIFIAVACLFNPVLPVSLPSNVSMPVSIATMLLFAVAIRRSWSAPGLSLASITDRTPGRESL